MATRGRKGGRKGKHGREDWRELRQRARDYAHTHNGYAYPSMMDELTEVHADVTYGNDETDSVIFWSRGRVWKLFVQPCCVESRSDEDAPRFILQRYEGEVPADLGSMRLTQGPKGAPPPVLRVVGGKGGGKVPTPKQLAEWHDGWADSGAWDDVWEGENAADLLEAFDNLVNEW